MKFKNVIESPPPHTHKAGGISEVDTAVREKSDLCCLQGPNTKVSQEKSQRHYRDPKPAVISPQINILQ